MRRRIDNRIRQADIPRAGVCAFGDLMPLLPCRVQARIPDGARSVIVCLFPYRAGEFPRRNVARYAVGDDYHRIVGELLEAAAEKLREDFPGEAFAPFVDNSPLREVEAGRLAGLGAVGRHGQLIHPLYGSYAFIGAIVTTLALEPDAPAEEACLACGRCVAACPTGALRGDGFDKARCRSHITQKKGALTGWERQQIREGGLLWGCDLCTDACPLNRRAAGQALAAFRVHEAPWLEPAELAPLQGRKAWGWRGARLLERNWRLLYGDNTGEE